MDHQDWKPIVLRKTEHKSQPPQHSTGYKKLKNLDSDNPEAPKTLGLTVAKRIQQGRVSKNLTQKQLAQKINVKPQVITEYETGKAIPNQTILNKIARTLGIKLKKK